MIEKDNYVKISVDMLGSETSIENIIKGLNNSFLRNINWIVEHKAKSWKKIEKHQKIA